MKSDSPDYALSLAKCFFQLEGYHEIFPLLRPFLEQEDINNYEMFFLVGAGFQRGGELARAVDVLERAVDKFGINTQLLNTLGDCYIGLGRTEEARAAWEKSLELRADQPHIKKNLEAIKRKK